jgi:hypothetical protein
MVTNEKEKHVTLGRGEVFWVVMPWSVEVGEDFLPPSTE